MSHAVDLEVKKLKHASNEKENDRQHAADEREKDRQHTVELEDMRLQNAMEKEAKKTESLIRLASDNLTRCLTSVTQADDKDACSIARIITEMLGSLDRPRELHCDLHAILGDERREEVIRASEDIEKKVLECRVRLRAITDTQVERERTEIGHSGRERTYRDRTLRSRENVPKSNNPGRKSNCGVKSCWGRLTTRQHLWVTPNWWNSVRT